MSWSITKIIRLLILSVVSYISVYKVHIGKGFKKTQIPPKNSFKLKVNFLIMHAYYFWFYFYHKNVMVNIVHLQIKILQCTGIKKYTCMYLTNTIHRLF